MGSLFASMITDSALPRSTQTECHEDRLARIDAAIAVEVIEHIDVPSLAGFEQVFEYERP